MPEITNGQSKAPRGFAAMSPELRAKLWRRGGKVTAKRYGKKHMSRIGRRGRAKRTRLERAAKLTVVI